MKRSIGAKTLIYPAPTWIVGSYDTHGRPDVGIQFRHEFGQDIHAPGFYVHIAPDECFLALGVWRPDRSSLVQIRQAIVPYSLNSRAELSMRPVLWLF